jgi:hypothetical protein
MAPVAPVGRSGRRPGQPTAGLALGRPAAGGGYAGLGRGGDHLAAAIDAARDAHRRRERKKGRRLVLAECSSPGRRHPAADRADRGRPDDYAPGAPFNHYGDEVLKVYALARVAGI